MTPNDLDDDELRALFARHSGEVWVDPVGPAKVLARTVNRERTRAHRWAPPRWTEWWPAVAVAAAVVALLVILPNVLKALAPVDPAANTSFDVNLAAAADACAEASPPVKGKGVESATFISPVLTDATGELIPNEDPFPGDVSYPEVPRFCLFSPALRTVEEVNYWMTVINPTPSEMVPTPYQGSVSTGSLYSGKREGKYVYVGIFHFPEGLTEAKDYYDGEVLIEAVTSAQDTRSHGLGLDAPYIKVTFSSPAPLAPEDTVGIAARPGESLEWLKVPQYLRVGDAHPLPDVEPDLFDLRE